MRLLFKSPFIAAVALAGRSDGWPKAEGEHGSGKTPAQLRQAIMQGARPRKEKKMVGILGRDADTFPLKADRDPRALAAGTAPTCEVNGVETAFVECTGNGTECKQACLDACTGVDDCSCCVGGEDNFGIYGEACNGFQGKVCPDGSCSGSTACYNAAIGYVVDGCQNNFACVSAGDNGHLGRVVSSCNDYRACFNAAHNGGEIQEITSSCNADRACQNAAMYGHIEGLSLSCNADRACHSAASDGTIPNKMEGCCNSASACGHLAEDYHQDPGPDPDAEGEPLRPVQQDPDPDQCEAPLSSSPTKVPAEVPTMRPVSESNVEDEGSLDEISSMKSETSADAGIPLD